MAAEPVNFVSTFDDSAVTAGINKMIQSVDKGQAAFDDLSKAAGNVGISYAASIETARKENEALKNGMLQTKAEILRLEKQYNSLTVKSTANAKAIKQQIVALQQQNKASSILFQQNQNDIKELGRQAKESFGQAGQSMALTANQAQNLGFQFNDLFTQIGAGTSVMQALVQQGPQITQVFGGIGNTFRFAGQQALGFFKRLFTLKGGLTALAAGLTALTGIAVATYFRKSQEAGDRFEQSMAGLGARFDIVVGRVFEFGESIARVFSGEAFKGEVLENLTRIFSGYGDELDRAAESARKFTEVQQVLGRAANEFIVNEGQALRVVDELRAKVEDETQSIGSRTKALQEAGKIERGLETERIRAATLQAAALKAKIEQESAAGGISVEQGKLIADAERKVIDLLRDSAAREREDAAKIRAIREERARKLEEERKKVEALNKAYENLLERLSQRVEKAQISELLGTDKVQAEKEAALKEVDAFVNEIAAAATAAGRSLPEGFASDVQDLVSAVETEFRRAVDKLREGDKEQGVFAQLLLPKDKSGLEAAAQDPFTRLGRVFEEQQPLLQRIKDGIASAFGLSREELENGFQEISAGFNLAFGNFVQGLDAATEAQISAQDRIIERRREQVDELKELLDIELQRERDGFANSVGVRERELAEKQALLEAAEKKRAALEEKAARRTLIINSVQQASEATLTIARLLSASAKLGIFGFIAAAAVGVSTVFSILAQAKAQSAKFAQAPGFKEGTPFLDGPGNGKSDSIPAYLSRGERVVPAELNEQLGGAKMPNDLLIKYALSGMERERETAEQVRKRQANIDGHKYAKEAFAGLTRDDMAELMREVVNKMDEIPKHYYGADGSKVVERKKGGKVIKQTVKAKQ
jgi:Prophage tail length tape measure protein